MLLSTKALSGTKILILTLNRRKGNCSINGANKIMNYQSHSTVLYELELIQHFFRLRFNIFTENSERLTNLVNVTIGVANSSVFRIPRICYAAPPPCCYPAQFTSDFVDIGDNFNKVNRQNSIVDVRSFILHLNNSCNVIHFSLNPLYGIMTRKSCPLLNAHCQLFRLYVSYYD